VVRRHPRAVIAWAAIYVVVTMGPSILLWWMAGPEYVDLLRSLFQGPAKMDPQLLAVQAKVGPIGNLNLLIQWIWLSVSGAAIYRAVFDPTAARAAFIRVGRTELWLGLVILLLYLGTAFSSFAAVLLGAIPVLIAAALGTVTIGITVAVILGMVGIGAVLWFGSVLAMAMPMTVRDGRFRLFEAWQATRGARWKVFLLSMTVLVLLLLDVAILFGAQAAVVWAKAAGSGMEPAAYFARPAMELAVDLLPTLAVVGIAISVCAALVQIVTTAAWADGCRQLADDSASMEEVFA
jgi:hypothetical protein